MVKNVLVFVVALFLLVAPAWSAVEVDMETNLGTIRIELYEEKAPITVANFLKYVDSGFYSGTIFHRVIKGFMIQGGGFDTDRKKKPGMAPIKNEASNGLKNDRGTIAMARTSIVDSATSQFFINHINNDFLNFRSPDPRGYGYAVFGKVISGMDVVDKIAESPIKKGVGPFANLPVQTVEILSVKRVGK